MPIRTCPECGRILTTTVNKLRIEVWPTHNVTHVDDRREDARPGAGDWDHFREEHHFPPCPNSRQPV